MHNIITKVNIGNPKNRFNIELSFSSKRTWICGSEAKIGKKIIFFLQNQKLLKNKWSGTNNGISGNKNWELF